MRAMTRLFKVGARVGDSAHKRGLQVTFVEPDRNATRSRTDDSVHEQDYQPDDVLGVRLTDAARRKVRTGATQPARASR